MAVSISRGMAQHLPKLLEYNADTPTSLLEAAVVQWYWLQDTFPGRDQFNSLHQRIVELWRHLTPHLPGRRVDFCSMDDLEDGMTVTYLHIGHCAAGGVGRSVFCDRRNRLGRSHVCRSRTNTLWARDFQVASVGVDGARGVRQIPVVSLHDLDW